MLTALFCLLLFWYTSTPVSALYHNNRARSLCPNTCTTATVTVTVSNSSFQASCDTSTVRLPTTVTTSNGAADSSPTISVSRAGSILQSSAAAEANPVDPTAVRAAVNTSMKDSSGKCLTVDATAGDFRQNLIPITLKTCDGCRGQQWDMVTSGKHNNVPGQVLVVSSLTQGCLNFDPRRAIGDQVIMFSCGGRADGGGIVTDSQLFPFTIGLSKFALSPLNMKGAICLTGVNGRLTPKTCNNGVEQLFTIRLTEA